jgi:small nuclear ribonucleoprotein (snRNP)-like protein
MVTYAGEHQISSGI